MKFQIGDKVRIIEDTYQTLYDKRGREGYIEKLVNVGSDYKFVGYKLKDYDGYIFQSEDFEYINPFKKGDMVKVLNINNLGLNSQWKVGDIGYVHSTGIDWGVQPKYTYLSLNKNDLTYREGGGGFLPNQLKLLTKFKVGDRVKILSKSTGVALKNCLFGPNPVVAHIISETIIIKDIHSKYCHFLEDDLELVEEKEEKMKYKFIKDFSAFNFLLDCRTGKCGASTKEQRNFLRKLEELCLSPSTTILMSKEFHDYFTKHDCFLNYLIEEKYIELINAFQPFTFEIPIESLHELKALMDIFNYVITSEYASKYTKQLYSILNKLTTIYNASYYNNI